VSSSQLPSAVQRRVDEALAVARGSAQQSPVAMPWQSQANVSNVTYAPSHVAPVRGGRWRRLVACCCDSE
jgi:hypothetical protein